jgi:DNA helicase-2/ATP-dependent DNA helicase PcrA
VAHVDGPLIVFAGAGSGKTRVITYRIANLLATHEIPPYRVLAVTFTNKAAGEMRERLDKLVGHELTRSLWIGTFHAVCARLIRAYHEHVGLGRNFVIYDDSDQKALMTRVVKDLGLDPKRVAPQKVLARIGREKQEGRGPEDFSPETYFDEIAKRCFVAYEERLRAANAADFDDLLLVMMRLAEGKGAASEHLARRFSHVLVDEFQDVNQVQYRLVRALAGERRNICVVGDDDQSIYQWRGADVRNIRGFTRDYPDAKLVKLEQNYRSSAQVVKAALGVIRPARDRQPKELWTDNPAGEKVKLVYAANERDEAAFVVDRVKRLIAGGTSPSNVAVFYRVHAQSRVLEEVMRSENVPYQIVGGLKFFDRAEVKDLLAYLRVIVNPASDVDLLRIINRPARKLGNKTIEQLVAKADRMRISAFDAIGPLCESDTIGQGAKKSLSAFRQMFEGWTQEAESASPHDLAEDVLMRSGYAASLEQQDSAEADARLDNLRELVGSIGEYEEEALYAGESATLADYLTRVSLVADQDTLENVPRVPMMTVHAAKGLEFDTVFLTGMEERLFPLRGQEEREREQLEEERRLAYVAITRARKLLHVLHANTRTIYGELRYNEPSRFLADLPASAVERTPTPAMGELSRGFTYERTVPSWHTIVRAGSRFEEVKKEVRKPGERFVEPDFDVGDAYDVDEAADVRVGARVRHAKFGVGVVDGIDGGHDPSVTVKFSGWGRKRIKLRYLSPA